MAKFKTEKQLEKLSVDDLLEEIHLASDAQDELRAYKKMVTVVLDKRDAEEKIAKMGLSADQLAHVQALGVGGIESAEEVGVPGE